MLVPDVNICAKCNKEIYPVEEWKYLDKTWHKMCVKCTVSDMVLDINNNKRFDKMQNSDNQAIRRESDVPAVSAQTKRILIHGTSGVGKSSLIKLVTGIQTIGSGCRTVGSSYEFDFETELTESNRETSTGSEKNGNCIFYDTAGLNEPQY
jgi:predicted GTPase